jgi:1,4-alpha-glucan branching enzyme
MLYKYLIFSRYHGYEVDKADPLAFYTEAPPGTASIIWHLDYTWGDQDWLSQRHAHNALNAPMAIYEVHLGSWMRVPEEGHRPLFYHELASRLADYVRRLGFTHVEFLPMMEHACYDSWGYQTTGYFAPTSRYGTPQDFIYLIDYLHQHGIGVILDWVPAHFSTATHGLSFFDGTHLDVLLIVCNFTPIPRLDHQVGVPRGGNWREICNSDAQGYGGSGCGNPGNVAAAPVSCHGQPYSLSLTLPPLAALYFKSDGSRA